MTSSKLTIIRAVRDMAIVDGRIDRKERKLLGLITEVMSLSPAEREALNSHNEPLDLATLPSVLTQHADQLQLMELAVLVGLADGVESPQEQERLRELATAFRLGPGDIASCLERARDRFFALTRIWEAEGD